MLLRLRAFELGDNLKTYLADRDKLFKKDDAYKRWSRRRIPVGRVGEGVGSNSKLLDLMLSVDSATLSGSRKLFAGCEEKTQAALVAAISKLPAKAFAGMNDVRDDPFGGFAKKPGRCWSTIPGQRRGQRLGAVSSPVGDRRFLMASLQRCRASVDRAPPPTSRCSTRS